MALASSSANVDSAKTGYIPPFRPLPITGDGPIAGLEASGGALIDHAFSQFAGEDAEEAEEAAGPRSGGEGDEDSLFGGAGYDDWRPALPPDPRFRAPAEAFAALVEFFEMLSSQVSGGFGRTPADIERMKRALAAYELVEQVIRGTLPKPGQSLSIAL